MVSVTLYNRKFIETKLDDAKDHEEKVNKCVYYLIEKYNTAYQNMLAIGINMTFAIKKLEELKFEKENKIRLLHSNSSKPKNNKKLVQSKLDKVNVDLQIVTDCVNHITNKYNLACQQVQDIYINIGHALKSSEIAVNNRKALEDKLK
jgi:hypothetical protein